MVRDAFARDEVEEKSDPPRNNVLSGVVWKVRER